MCMKKNGVALTVAFLLGLGGLFAGLFVAQHMHSQKKVNVAEFHGTYLATPRSVNQFSFLGTDNKKFDNESLQGHWTLMFFGFTNCGYLCPTTLAELGKMYKLLEQKGVSNLPQVVMVTIDPDRDTLEKLGGYVKAFNPNFYGARGEEASIQIITREMGIAYAKVYNKDNADTKNYDVEHSGAVMLFNPQGELNAFFTTPHHAELLVKDYMQLAS